MSEEMKTPNPNPNGAKPMKSEEDTAMDMMGYNKNSFGGFDRTKGELDKRINYKGNQLGARTMEMSPDERKVLNDKTTKQRPWRLEKDDASQLNDRYYGRSTDPLLGGWSKKDQAKNEADQMKKFGTMNPEEDAAMKMMGYPEEKVEPNKYDIPFSSKNPDVPAYLTVKMKDGGVTYYELSEGETVNDALSRMEEEAGDLIDGVYDNVTNWGPGPSIWRK